MLTQKRITYAKYLGIAWLIINVLSGVQGRAPDRLTRIRCPTPESIPNGSYRLRRNNMIMRVQCRPGFEIQGPRIVDCVHGKWYGQKPVCAKRGCQVNISNPDHGIIQIDNGLRMVLFCLDNYNLAGNRFAYCNGTHWDREIGNCRELSFNVEHECDFETDDLCGWVYEETVGTEWKRVMAANVYTSFHTGPRHDHTTMTASGGHYMLMETTMPSAEPGLFLSPVYERDLSLKTACCFRFYYFMYGSGVGDLKVYVRPVTIPVKTLILQEEYLRFHKSGNQNNLWNEAHFKIEELSEDFQIIFVATAGRNHLSDIAIDDVKLMTGEDCTALDRPNEDDDDSGSEEVTDEVLFDTQSCVGRCLEQSGAGFVRKGGQLFGRCNCHAECEEDESCCPDFRIVCLSVIFEQTTQINEYITPNMTYESDQSANTTSTVQVIKLKVTTTPSTTTSTTPTTMTSTTTTTTTSTTPTTTTSTTPTTTTTSTTSKKPTSTTRKTTTTKRTTSSTTKSTTTTPKTTLKTTATTRKTTPIKTTTPKPATKTIFVSKTTPKPTTSTKTTTIKQKIITTTTTTMTITTGSTTTSKPTTTSAVLPKKMHGDTRIQPRRQEIASWSIDNSSKKIESSPSKILLTALFLLLIVLLVTIAYNRYREDVDTWYTQLIRGRNETSGDVETTSIRAKFRARTNQFSNSSAIVDIKSRLGLSSRTGNDDMNCLIDTDNDSFNDADLSIDNPIAITRENAQKGSLSTNL